MYEQFLQHRSGERRYSEKREVFEEVSLPEDRRKLGNKMINCFTSLLEDPTEKENILFPSEPYEQ
jgi:hypothetical protein